MRQLWFGDNLEVMREHIPTASVDLVYLDPPFNSKARYNVLFTSKTGKTASAQGEAFKDTWKWEDGADQAMREIAFAGGATASIVNALYQALGRVDLMAYLAMMAVRLHEISRAMKPTASLYLHCDPTASHYLKVILDGIFGPENYRSEISWKRSTSHGNVSQNYGALRDVILYYTKTRSFTWNQQYAPISPEYAKRFNNSDPDGRRWQSVSLRNPSVRPNLQYEFSARNGKTYRPHPNGWAVKRERMVEYDEKSLLHYPASEGGTLRLKKYLDENPGVKLQNNWDDVPAINAQAREREGYPTQKPRKLLERIISVSSNPGDVVFDPFCGCGTTVDAAEFLGRSWVGIDVAVHAIKIIEDRLVASYGEDLKYAINGMPRDLESARRLAENDKYQFQWWANYLIGVQQLREVKKGRDRGVDGLMYFYAGPGRGYGRILTSVKGGRNVGVGDVREFLSVLAREGADAGVFVCLRSPTRDMRAEARAAGIHTVGGSVYPKLQILSIEDYFMDGRKLELPPLAPIERRASTASRPSRAHKADPRQQSLLLPFVESDATGATHLNPSAVRPFGMERQEPRTAS